MSLPVDAAVAEVFATFSVSVAVERTQASGTPSSSATTWHTFVLTPCPISVAEWFTTTDPSTYT